jgi:hypothetical protein
MTPSISIKVDSFQVIYENDPMNLYDNLHKFQLA